MCNSKEYTLQLLQYLIIILFPFSSMGKAQNEGVEHQNPLSILESLNNRSFGTACEANYFQRDSQKCPEVLLEQHILRDRNRSLTAQSPEQICHNSAVSLHPSRNPFQTPNDLERYIREDKKFSDFSHLPPITSCLSQPIKVNRVGQWSAIEFERTLPDNKRSLFLTEYYASLYRLDEGMQNNFEDILAIDQLIGVEDGALAGDIPCSNLSEETAKKCEEAKQCKKESPSDSLQLASRNTIIALQGIGAIEEIIKKIRGPRNRATESLPTEKKEKIRQLEAMRTNIENVYPWIVGRKFQSSYDADDFEDFLIGNAQMEAQMGEIIKEQLSDTREKLKEHQDQLQKAGHCLVENTSCKEVDLDTILAKAPAIDTQMFASDTDDIKASAMSGLLNQVSCLETQRKTVQEVNKHWTWAALDVGIIAGTFGLGTPLVAGKTAASVAINAARGGKALNQAQRANKAQKLQSLGVIGVDSGFSVPYMEEALSQCDTLMNQMERTFVPANTDTDGEKSLCQQLPVRSAVKSNLQECLLGGVLASLPMVLGGGFAFQVVNKANKTTRALSKVEDVNRNRRVLAEEALGRKLTYQQTDAVERAHLVGLGEVGKDGINPARIGNYTEAHLREKAKILQQAGFSKLERETLIKKGVVGLLELAGNSFQMAGMIYGVGIAGGAALSVSVLTTIFGSRFIRRMSNVVKLKKQILPVIGRELTPKQANWLQWNFSPYLDHHGIYHYYDLRNYRDRAKAVAQQRRKEDMDYGHQYSWRSEMEKRGIRQEQQARNRQWLEEADFSQAEIRLEPYFDDVGEVIRFKRDLSRKGIDISATDIQRLHLYERKHRVFVERLLDVGFSKDEIAKLFRAKVL